MDSEARRPISKLETGFPLHKNKIASVFHKTAAGAHPRVTKEQGYSEACKRVRSSIFTIDASTFDLSKAFDCTKKGGSHHDELIDIYSKLQLRYFVLNFL